MKNSVYATSKQNLITRLASRVSERSRQRRHANFHTLTNLRSESKVVDLGCGPLGLKALEPDLDITGVDLLPRPDYPGTFVQADLTKPLPFKDNEFDLAYCNSLIEHLPRSSRLLFASEVKRVAKSWYVQTPAFSFPIEPHALLPFAHWFPIRLRKKYWRYGVQKNWEQIDLLTRSEMEELFGPATPEKLGLLTKSWIVSCYR